MEQAASGVMSRLVVRKVTVSRTIEGHFVSMSCGVGDADPGYTLGEASEALLGVGHELDKVILERGFLSRTMPPDLLASGRAGLDALYDKYMERRRLAARSGTTS